MNVSTYTIYSCQSYLNIQSLNTGAKLPVIAPFSLMVLKTNTENLKGCIRAVTEGVDC